MSSYMLLSALRRSGIEISVLKPDERLRRFNVPSWSMNCDRMSTWKLA